MIANLNLPKFKKAILLFFFVLSFSNINAATYYLKNSGGLWNVPGTWSTVSGSSDVNATNSWPQAGDDVIFDGTVARTLNMIASATCTSITNLTTSTNAPVITLNIGSSFTLTVSGNFANDGTADYSRNTTLTGTGTMTVGGNINVGTQTLTATAARTNTMLFSGPNITVTGNVNIYNNVNSTTYIASSVVHSAGILTLTGTGTNGYLNTFQHAGGLSSDNRYYMTAGTASLVFYHVTQCPVFCQQNVLNAPVLNGTGATVTYRGTGAASIIYGSSYYNLYLNNSSNYTTNGITTVTKQLDLVAGGLNIGNYNFSMSGSNGADTTINISSSSATGISRGSGNFSYGTNVNLNYSGAVPKPGIELIYGNTTPVTTIDNTRLKSLTITGTSNFNLNTDGSNILTNILNVFGSVSINDNNFTCRAVINSPSISINGGTSNALVLSTALSSAISNTISGTGITIQGKTITVSNLIASTGTSNGIGNTVTITATTSISYSKNITANGQLSITAPTITYTTTPTISGGSIIINGVTSANLYILTATNSGGISLTGGAITLDSTVTSNYGGGITINSTGLLTYKSTISATGSNVLINNSSETGTAISTSAGAISALSINIKGATTLFALTSTSGSTGIIINGNIVLLSGVLLASNSGAITINSTSLSYNKNITAIGGVVSINSPTISTTVTTGTISAISGSSIDINAGTTGTLYILTATGSGGISITGGTINLNGTLTSNSGNITINTTGLLTYNSTIQATGNNVLINNNNGPGTVIASSSGAVDAGNITIKGATTLYALTSSGLEGITLTGTIIDLKDIVNSSYGITITGTQLNYYSNLIALGEITITAETNADTTSMPYITGNSIQVNGTSTLYALTANGETGITLTGSTLTLNGTLSAPTITAGIININGNTTTSATIIANTINLSGTSTFSGAITAAGEFTGLTINGPTTFDSAALVTANKITVETSGTGSVFNVAVEGLNFLTINGSTNMVVNETIGNTLTLAANLNNDGIIITHNLTVTGNSTLNTNGTGQVKVSDVLSVSNGVVLNTGGELTLLSDSGNTARVAVIEPDAIIGDVTVERFLTNENRLWRLLTSPVKGASINTLYETWQLNGTNDNLSGTDVWGPLDTYNLVDNGLLYLPNSTHNFRKYTNNTWTSISNTKTENLFDSTKNNAFLTFITRPAGSGVNTSVSPYVGVPNSGPTTLRAKGSLLIGDQTYDLTGSSFYLVGNPYASPLEFTNLISAGGINGNTISDQIWIMDPKLGNFGNYVSWDPVTLYSDYPASQNSINGTTSIQSGQGFFVKKKPGATSNIFTIKETDKATGVYTNVFGKNTFTNYERLRVNLDKIDNNIDLHKDACVAGFYNGGVNIVNYKDAIKFTNPAETLAFLNGSTALSSEHRAPIVNGDTMFLKLTQAAENSIYKLKIHTENFTFTGSAYLHDLLLGTSMAIPLDGTVYEYAFTVTADPFSQGARFKIVFNSLLGTQNNSNPNAIIAYPNPATEGVTLNLGTLDNGNYSYKIVNILGQEMQNGTLVKEEINEEFKIDFTTTLKSGWYSIQILNQNSTIFTLPILIR